MNTQFERLNKKEREAIRRLREQVKEEQMGASRGGGESLPVTLAQAAANGAYIGSQPSGQVSE
jgi:hypothetical protein